VDVRQRSSRTGFALVVALIALVPVTKAVLYDTLDPDSFIHLLAADQMCREGVGPIVDSQSYMSVREAWTPYSWLAELGMKVAWDRWGYRAAILTHALMAGGLIGVIALACATRSERGQDGDLRATIATAFAAYLSIPYLSFRPVTAALVVMACVVWLLVRDRVRDERTRAVWLVVPLTVLLVNLHLYAIIVPAWVFALLAGSVWEAWRGAGDGRRRIVRYAVLLVATSLACLATPMLPGVLRSIAFYQAADPMVGGSVVKEYLPFYAGTSGKISAALVVGLAVLVVARHRVLRAGEMFWLLGSGLLLLRMGRFSPVFAMAAAPILAAALPRLSDRVLARPVIRLALAVVVIVGIVRVGLGFPRTGVTLDAWLERNGPDGPGYPTAAAAFVDANVPRRTGRLINEYTWGGYLSWRLGPRFKVLLDGRTNLFTPEFWGKTYLAAPAERAEFLRSIDADAAILPNANSVFEEGLIRRGWAVAHADARAKVLVPPVTEPGASTQ
jgi:hypothetical protein